MRKRRIYLSLAVLLFSNFLSKAQCFPIDTLKLNKTYEAFLGEPTSYEKQLAFFDAFPANFLDFYMVYRYQKGKDCDLAMYKKGVDHIIYGLYKLDLISDTAFCDKIIGLSLGGFWEADAPNYLQQLVHHTMSKNQTAMFDRIDILSAAQQVSFWFFYFHSRFEEKGEYNALEREMTVKYPKVIESMKLAYPASNGKVWY